MTRTTRIFIALVLAPILALSAQGSRAALPHKGVPASWIQGWPMTGHDLQRTNRSPAAVSTSLHLLFQIRTRLIDPVVDASGGIYGFGRRGLIALNAAGQVRWRYPLVLLDSPPALTPSGTIVVGAIPVGRAVDPNEVRLYAINSHGRKRWSIRPHLFAKTTPLLTTASGNILAPYVGPDNANMRIFNESGVLLHLIPGSFGVVAVSPTGTICTSESDSVIGTSILTAFDSAGHPLWKMDLGTTLSGRHLMVGRNGTVFASNGPQLHAIDPNGRVLWTYHAGSEVVQLAERADGAVLVVEQENLFALGPDGDIVWHHAIPPIPASAAAGLATDANNTAYLALPDGTLRGVASDGTELFSLSIGRPGKLARPQVVIDAQGRLIVSGADSTLYVF
jgi:outer membrane protein assembly factor BamB